ncbi:MAG: diacylglycerol kinase (ATP) [Gammaproteobacteria bacterium]|jgi:diacylglycerol kinase (ATP)
MPEKVKIAYERIGIITNPLSGRIKNNVSTFKNLALSIPGAIYREACNQPEFERVVLEFAEYQIDLLVILAGDGTIHGLLSIILSKQTLSPIPKFAFIPAGTTNMTAKDFNTFGHPEKVLEKLKKLLEDKQAYTFVDRSVLCVRHGDDVPRHGMFFGTGIIADGVKYFQKRVRRTGITGEKASAIVLLRYLFFLLSGRSDTANENVKIHIQTNIDEGKEEDSLLIFATCLERLLLGMRPYWGQQEKQIHSTFVQQSPRKLWRSILPLLTGKGRGLSPSDGYRSDNLSSLILTMTGDYIIDGEVYSADQRKGKVYISADDSISVMELKI